VQPACHSRITRAALFAIIRVSRPGCVEVVRDTAWPWCPEPRAAELWAPRCSIRYLFLCLASAPTSTPAPINACRADRARRADLQRAATSDFTASRHDAVARIRAAGRCLHTAIHAACVASAPPGVRDMFMNSLREACLASRDRPNNVLSFAR